MTVLNVLIYLGLCGVLDIVLQRPWGYNWPDAIAALAILVSLEFTRWWAVRCERNRVNGSLLKWVEELKLQKDQPDGTDRPN